MVKTSRAERRDINTIRKVLNGGRKSWGELLKETGISNSNMKRRLDLMIAAKEVSMTYDEEDRRRSLYYLTDRTKSRNEHRRFYLSEFLAEMESPVAAEDRTDGIIFNMFMQTEVKDEEQRKELKRFLDRLLKEQAERESQTHIMQSLARRGRVSKLAFVVSIDTKI